VAASKPKSFQVGPALLFFGVLLMGGILVTALGLSGHRPGEYVTLGLVVALSSAYGCVRTLILSRRDK
jgi:hypothetical protein